MRIKREKGFRKIEIIDPDSEIVRYPSVSIFNIKCTICLIICGFIILLFIFSEIYYLFSRENNLKLINNNKKKKIKNDYNLQMHNNADNNKDVSNNNKGTNDIYTKKFDLVKKPKISIIIVVNDGNEDIGRLFESIQGQTLIDIEINVVDDCINNYNNSFLMYDKIKLNDKRIQIIKYKNNVGKLQKRIDGINNSKGKYILFIEANDFFISNNVLENIYNKATEDKIDILEFKSYHYLQCRESSPIYQPELFDVMYFDKDNFFQMRQFHIEGKIIRTKFLKNIIKKIDNFYINNKIYGFEESMLLFIMFQNAESFELLRIQGLNNNCNVCDLNMDVNSEPIKKDLLLYLKFMVQYSNDVPETRLSANLFINNVIDKGITFSNKNNIKLLNDTMNLYLNCEKIGELELKRIKAYQNHIYSIEEEEENEKQLR